MRLYCKLHSKLGNQGYQEENEGKLFHKNSHPGNLWETSGLNEREFRFQHKFQLHSKIGGRGGGDMSIYLKITNFLRNIIEVAMANFF